MTSPCLGIGYTFPFAEIVGVLSGGFVFCVGVNPFCV